MKATERKCHSCGGYGTILFNGVLRGCKSCDGKGKVNLPTGIKRRSSLLFSTLEPLTPSPNMTTSQRLHLRASLLELARLIFGTLLIAAAVASLPFLFAVL